MGKKVVETPAAEPMKLRTQQSKTEFYHASQFSVFLFSFFLFFLSL